MSKKRKPRPNHGRTAEPQRKRVPTVALVVLALAAAAIVGLWLSRPRQEAMPAAASSARTHAADQEGAAMLASNPAFQKLPGRWLRPDGYVLEIKSTGEAGKIEAAYFNPRSIHVARAEVSQDGSALKVFVELRDVNYPGSTYTLTYDPDSDQLKGIYYQAVERQQYEIYFVRVK